MSTQNDDAATDLLIKEVDEDLRQENLEKLWKRYGNLVVGASVALVLAVAANQGWHAWTAREKLKSSTQFSEASRLVEQGKKDDAAAILGKLAADGTSGYRILAELKLADLKQQTGDYSAAAALYEKIASGSGDETYRASAKLKAAYLKLDGADAASVEAMVQPLAVESSPWRHSAREVLALAALKAGDQPKAKDLFAKLADDTAAPQGLRARAAEMLAVLDANKPAK